ncbi:MAG TPA: class I tRNA ligase family protein, partial [Thermoplasmata archaeon]|nr:class I tRNA ligase family protein [Thermoplasmata archaeon]
VPTIEKTAHRTLSTLLHVYDFYRENAQADRAPHQSVPPTPRSLLDRWLLSRVDAAREITERSLDSAEIRGGATALETLVTDLSTWYLRRSRERFWEETDPADREEAYATLSFTLLTVAKLLAPYTPFTAEWLFQKVSGLDLQDPGRSVHGEAFPTPSGRRDVALEEAMADLREWVEVGREMRQRAGVKSRVPLPEFVLASAAPPVFVHLGEEGEALVREELNVRRFRWVSGSAGSEFSEAEWIRRDLPQEHHAFLSRRPTEELRREGLFREAMRRLQLTRREEKLGYLERVGFHVHAEGEFGEVLVAARDRAARELLAEPLELVAAPLPDGPGVHRYEIDGLKLEVRVDRRAA